MNRRHRFARASAATAVAGGVLLAAIAALVAPSWRSTSDDDAAVRARDETPPRLREPALAARPASESETAAAAAATSPTQRSAGAAGGPGAVGDIDPMLDASVRLVDGATGRVLSDADLDGHRAGGFASSMGGGGTYAISLILPNSERWRPPDGSEAIPIERRGGLDRARPADATSAVIVWPLYRATEIRLRVVDGRGHPVPDARLRQWTGLGRNVALDVAAAGDGVVRLAGLPFLPREVVWLVVRSSVADADVPASIDSAHRDTRSLYAVARVVLPDAWVPSIDATLSLDASSAILDAELADHNETDNDLPSTFGTLRIRARRRDGTAAAGALLKITAALPRDSGPQRADASGQVEVRVPAYGPVHVSLADVSLVPTTVEVTPRADQTVDVLLEEPEPSSLEVLVSFADGRRVPFARLSIVTPSGVPAWDLVDGVLRLDPFTDENGRRVYTRVEPAEVTVSAQWGSRSAATQVSLSPGHRGTARLVLPDPPDQRPAGIGGGLDDLESIPALPAPREAPR